MRVVRISAAVLALAAFSAGVSSCSDEPDNGVAGDAPEQSQQLTIYTSLPSRGIESVRANRLLNGMRLALAERKGEIDGYQIKLSSRDDTGKDGVWDDGQVLDNARLAIRDPTTVAYIGELDSGASALSIPILNEAGILQVSPASGYSGLTRKGVVQGEPDKYYPSGKRTFGRVIPNDHVQALAQVEYQRDQGCDSVYLLSDDGVYGTGLARDLEALLQADGPPIAGNEMFDAMALDYTDVAEAVAAEKPDCVFYGGDNIESAVRMWRALHRADPDMKLFGPDRLATSVFTQDIGSAGPVTFLTSPLLRSADYPAKAREVLRAYRKTYNEIPDINALHGYATMDAVLTAIEEGRGPGSRQQQTIRAFLELDGDSVLGPFSIDDNGDTSYSKYGTYNVRRDKPVFDEVIDTAR